MTTAEALAILGLSRRVTRSEVRIAYRDLVKVWHPDRFSSDRRLHDKAQAQLASINCAYEFLSSGWDQGSGSTQAEGTRPQRHRAAGPSAPPRQPEPAEASPHSQSSSPGSSRKAARAGLHLLLYGFSLIIAIVIAMALGDDIGRRFESPSTTNVAVDAQDQFTAHAPPVSAKGSSLSSEALPLRPENAEVLRSPSARGLGVLQISNGTSMDAAVLLVPLADEMDVQAIYVRAGASGEMSTIAPRAYRLRFMLGHNWLGEDFGADTEFNEFANLVSFREQNTRTAHEYEEMSVTLNAGEAGNARTKPIPPFRLAVR